MMMMRSMVHRQRPWHGGSSTSSSGDSDGRRSDHRKYNNRYHTTSRRVVFIVLIVPVVILVAIVEAFVGVVTTTTTTSTTTHRHPSSAIVSPVQQRQRNPWQMLHPQQSWTNRVIPTSIATHTDDGTDSSHVTNTICDHPQSSTATTTIINTTGCSTGSTPTKNVGLYIHIPYCRKRCYYCNFAIVPIGNQFTINYTPMSTVSHQTENDSQPPQHPVVPTRNDGFHTMNDQYVQAMIQELQLIALQYRPTIDTTTTVTTEQIVLQSIYFGGGTPSLLPMVSLREILDAIRHIDSIFMISDDCEMTMEIDPGTFTRTMVQEWKLLGINRFSLGVQSMDDRLLRQLGRTHTVSDIYHSIQRLQSVYGSSTEDENDEESHLNYSIDLISGIPGLTIAKWMDTLQMVTNTLHPPPKHCSIYDLQIETNTVFGRRYQNRRDSDDDDDNDTDDKSRNPETLSSYQTGTTTTTNIALPSWQNKNDTMNLPLPSLQDAAFMYKYASGYLRSKSYEHYEISSYAYIPQKRQQRQSSSKHTNGDVDVVNTSSFSSPLSPEHMSYRSRHNQIYWGYHNVSAWYAVGLGSTSFDLRRQITKRPNAMSDYIQWVDAQLTVARSTTKEEHHLDRQNNTEQVVEEVMDIVLKRLRTSDGLSLQHIQEQYGNIYVDAIRKGVQDVLENDPKHNLITIQHTTTNTTMNDCCEDRILRLVDPMGFIYSNTIISNIFYELLLIHEP